MTGISVIQQKEAINLFVQEKKTGALVVDEKKVNIPIGKASTPEQTLGEIKGPGLDETMTKFYGKKYEKASEEEKEKLIVNYFDWLNKDKKDVVNQFDQFKLYKNRCKGDDEYKRLSSVIDKLATKYQLSAAKSVMYEGTGKQKAIGQMAVAEDYYNYDKSVQKDVAQLVVGTKNSVAIKTAATYASKTDKSNQVDVVRTFQKIENKDVNKVLIDQYANYAKENQVGVHKVMSASKLSETVEYAASNIFHFHKDNQALAVKVTTETGNEAAIKAAAANYSKYDKSAQSEIKSIINETPYESAKTILQEQAEFEAEMNARAMTGGYDINNLNEVIASGSQTALEIYLKNCTDAEKIAIAKAYSGSSKIIDIILSNNPSVYVINAVSQLKGAAESKSVQANIVFLDATAQSSMLSPDNLNQINGSKLKGCAKLLFDKLVQNKEKKENNVMFS